MSPSLRHGTVVLLAFAFLVATAGITVVHHFCMGESAGTSLFVPKGCCDDEESMPQGCCHNEVTVEHLDAPAIAADCALPLAAPASAAIVPPEILRVPLLQPSIQCFSGVDHAPPPGGDVSLFIHSLLI